MRTTADLVEENEELRRERDGAREERDRLRALVGAYEQALAELVREDAAESGERAWN